MTLQKSYSLKLICWIFPLYIYPDIPCNLHLIGNLNQNYPIPTQNMRFGAKIICWWRIITSCFRPGRGSKLVTLGKNITNPTGSRHHQDDHDDDADDGDGNGDDDDDNDDVDNDHLGHLDDVWNQLDL